MGRHETENIRVYMGLIWYFEEHFGASLVAQMVKNPPAMQEIWVRSLGQEISPGEGNGNPLQYSCLENSMDRGAWQAIVHGVARVRHDLATKDRERYSSQKSFCLYTFCKRRPGVQTRFLGRI